MVDYMTRELNDNTGDFTELREFGAKRTTDRLMGITWEMTTSMGVCCERELDRSINNTL